MLLDDLKQSYVNKTDIEMNYVLASYHHRAQLLLT